MKNILLFALCFLTIGISFSQEELSKEEKERREKNIQAGNPFAEFGYKAKVATLSKGKYLEVHDLDSIVKIGSSLWHVKKHKIVGNVMQDTTDMYRQPLFDTAGRWLSPDPLAEEFPEWSPYHYTYNNPLNYTDPDGRSGKPVIDKENKTITVHSNITFYGDAGSKELASKATSNIQKQWNAANGKVNIDGVEYSVNFSITGTYDNSISAEDISNNTDIENNFIKIVDEGIAVSYMDGAGSNTGVFLADNINDKNSTTESHEIGHGYGLEHPDNTDLRGKGQPGIMYPRGTMVDSKYTYNPERGNSKYDSSGRRTNTLNPVYRKVTQKDINNLGLDEIKYNPKTGAGNLGNLTNQHH